MAKSKKPKKTDEKPLINSLLTVNTIIEETRGTHTRFTCYVENYCLLEQLIDYKIFHRIYSYSWEICFRKDHEVLFVYLNTDSFIKDVVFGLRRSDGEIMESLRTEELVGGMLVAVFGEREISNPENLLLGNGTLILHCEYTARPLEYNIVLTRELQEKSVESIHNSDVVGLCNDLKHLYLNSSFSNFRIVAGDVAFKVHSLILSLRSHYFAELYRNDPYIVSDNIDASPEIVYEVLYIYSSELRNMEFTYMIEIFYIAGKWQIARLMKICIDYFNANLVAYQYNVIELKHKVLSFIRNLPHYLKETEEWAEIILEVRRIFDSMNL